MAVKLERGDWARDPVDWKGRFEGKDIGTGVTVLFFSDDRIGSGPVLHRHPYDEVFILRQGRALFTIGTETVEAGAGEILLALPVNPTSSRTSAPDVLRRRTSI